MINQDELAKFVENCIVEYHEKMLAKLGKLKLNNVLKRKNPYLFKVKSINTSHELIESILSAHLSSQEESVFGTVLEEIAIYICGKVKGGVKSSAEGIDIEFEDQGARYIVSVKSGPNWGNSSSIKKLEDHFKKAKRILGSNAKKQHVVAVNGCCYGRDDSPNKGDYLKLCGERFWTLISDDEDMYTQIIAPLGHEAYDRNEKFMAEYAKVVNRFTKDFTENYCSKDGEIQWEKLLKFNSSIKKK